MGATPSVAAGTPHGGGGSLLPESLALTLAPSLAVAHTSAASRF